MWKTRLPLLRVITAGTGGSVQGTTSVKLSLRLCRFTVHPDAGPVAMRSGIAQRTYETNDHERAATIRNNSMDACKVSVASPAADLGSAPNYVPLLE